MSTAILAGMSDEVGLRDVRRADLELFYQQENDPEAVRRSAFPPRNHEAFMTHWRTRALSLFLARERARPLYAEPFVGNAASVRLLEKAGFRRVGGVWYDGHEHLTFVPDGE